MNKFKELLGDQITDEAATQIQSVMDNAINERVLVADTEKSVIAQQLKEAKEALEKTAADHAAELNTLKEAHQLAIDEVALGAAEDATAALKEEKQKEIDAVALGVSDDITAALTEQHVIAVNKIHADYAILVTDLKEHAKTYGAYVKDAMEKDSAEKLTEAVAEFSKTHQKEFELLEDYNRMKSSFVSIKQAFETHGLQLSEETAYADLNKRIDEQKDTIAALQSKIDADAKEKSVIIRKNIFESVTKDIADTQRARLQTLTESIDAKSDEDYKSILELLVERVVTPSQPAAKVVDTQIPTGPLNENSRDRYAAGLM